MDVQELLEPDPAFLRELDEMQREQPLPEYPEWLLDAPHTLDVMTGQEPPAQVRWAVPGVYEVRLDPGVQRVVRSVQHLAEQPSYVPDDATALAEVVALLRAQQQLRALLLHRVRDVDERGLTIWHGHRSTKEWVADVAPDADPADLTLTRRLPELPTLQAALDARTVGVRSGHRLARVLVEARRYLDDPSGLIDGLDAEEVVTAVVGNVVDLVCRARYGVNPKRSPEDAAFLAGLEQRVTAIQRSGESQRARVEAAYVLLAEHLRGPALRDALEEQQYALVPSLLERKEKAAQEKRGLALSKQDDGTWHLEGTLTLECGERLWTALAAEARRDPANPEDTRARQEARRTTTDEEFLRQREPWETRGAFDVPSDELVPRSRTQRLHDAFARLLDRYLSAGLGGTRSKVPVQVLVTITEAAVTDRPGALPGRTGSGRVAARGLIRQWWCDAHVTPLLMSRGWTPLGAAHSARTVTATELKAAMAQFGNRCAGSGCCPGTPDPLIPLVPHHVRRHADTRETSLVETVLICETLHDDIHVGKRTVRLRDGSLLNESGWVAEPPLTSAD